MSVTAWQYAIAPRPEDRPDYEAGPAKHADNLGKGIVRQALWGRGQQRVAAVPHVAARRADDGRRDRAHGAG